MQESRNALGYQHVLQISCWVCIVIHPSLFKAVSSNEKSVRGFLLGPSDGEFSGGQVVMAVLTRGKSMLDSLVAGETTLKDIFGGKFPSEKQLELERSPSGTRKWIKELSSLANVVVGHCAR